MIWRPDREKYASAFWPPNVSWRTLRRCTSPESGDTVCSRIGSRMSIRTRKLDVIGSGCNVTFLSRMNDPKAPRPSRQPLLDSLGQMCTDGKQTAEYLWQVPKDAEARQKILELLTQIGIESTKQGRREMPKLVEEL